LACTPSYASAVKKIGKIDHTITELPEQYVPALLEQFGLNGLFQDVTVEVVDMLFQKTMENRTSE